MSAPDAAGEFDAAAVLNAPEFQDKAIVSAEQLYDGPDSSALPGTLLHTAPLCAFSWPLTRSAEELQRATHDDTTCKCVSVLFCYFPSY